MQELPWYSNDVGLDDVPEKENDKGKLIEAEERAVGSVSWDIYASYLRSSGTLLVILVGLSFLASKILNVLSDLWLTEWTKASDSTRTAFYLRIYAYLSLSTVGLIFVSDLASRFASLHASKRIHSTLFGRVLRARVQFFDTTPLGRYAIQPIHHSM